MQKILLSYDPEVESHPWTLLEVEVAVNEELQPPTTILTLVAAYQFTNLDNALEALKNPSKLKEWSVD
jgi:hypothetical protein